VHGALLAAVHPDNTPHGYNLTFAFPMLMFIIIAGALFLRFRGPHNVPGHATTAGTEATAMTGESAGGATVEAAAGAAADLGAGAAGEPAVNGQAQPAEESTEEG